MFGHQVKLLFVDYCMYILNLTCYYGNTDIAYIYTKQNADIVYVTKVKKE